MVSLLVLAATGPEMKVIKSHISQLKVPHLEVTYLVTGMGSHATILSLTKILSTRPTENQFDILLNIGVCGYAEEKADSIQVGSVMNIHTGKESIIPIPCLIGSIASIESSDIPVLQKHKSNYYDMESFAIDYVAQQFQIPRILLKVPVDKIGNETLCFDQEKALKALSENISYKDIIKEVMKYFGA